MPKILTNKKVIIYLFVMLLALSLAASRGINFGIEFAGGTRIPITLERTVDAGTMDEMVNNIKNRVSTFGLKQVVVKSIGDSEIYVELPQSDLEMINSTMSILSRQGKFEGIVDGKVAVSDQTLMPAGITSMPPYKQGKQVRWEVQFGLTEAGTRHFVETVHGKASYPVYMFLDRPEDSIILMTRQQLIGNTTMTEAEALSLLNGVLQKDGTSIPLFLLDRWDDTKAQLESMDRASYNKTIIAENADPAIAGELKAMGFTIHAKPPEELVPQYSSSEEMVYVTEWKAVGLLSAPLLSPDITEGEQVRMQRFYTISGYAPSYLPDSEQFEYAESELKMLKSVLKGGALPVHIIIGTPTTIPAPLGSEFLKYSIIGAIAVVLLTVLFVSLRCGNIKIMLPNFIMSSSELALLVLLVGGLGTIDLGAMAGIICAVGIGINDQILMADELLAQAHGLTKKRRLDNAFYIIVTNALVAVVAMIPLLFFSGLIEIMGFATSTIMGAFLGALITRPAFAVMLEHTLGMQDKNE